MGKSQIYEGSQIMITYDDLTFYRYTEEELEEYVDDFDFNHWELISMNQIISEDFIEKYHDRVIWRYISWQQELSENFILRNLEKIDLIFLKTNKKVSKDLFERAKFFKDLSE
jgi:hypothetical protein